MSSESCHVVVGENRSLSHVGLRKVETRSVVIALAPKARLARLCGYEVGPISWHLALSGLAFSDDHVIAMISRSRN